MLLKWDIPQLNPLFLDSHINRMFPCQHAVRKKELCYRTDRCDDMPEAYHDIHVPIAIMKNILRLYHDILFHYNES